jgi:hypothetical protein
MKPTLHEYQTGPSRQPESIQRHIRRGEALGRFLLRLSGYLRRLFWRLHGGAKRHGWDEERRPVLHAASVPHVKLDERKAARTQERNAQAANDEHYQSVA